jgi:transcription elongation factor S-II
MSNGEFRVKVRKYLSEIVDKHISESDIEKKKLFVNNIERNIFNTSLIFADKYSVAKQWTNIEFRDIYKDISNKILTNIDPDSYIGNSKLLNDTWEGTIDPVSLPKMSPDELYPAKWEQLIQEKIRREMLKYDMSNKAVTESYKCGKCKTSKAYYYQVQLRSSDEPMSLLLECCNCQNSWRIG